MAATTGTRRFSSRSRSRWPAREAASASAGVRKSLNCSMSAPAIHVPFFSERMTAALTLASASPSSRRRRMSSIAATRSAEMTLTGFPGWSSRMMAIPSSTSMCTGAPVSVSIVAMRSSWSGLADWLVR
jgi:hypothetical protein